MELEKLDPDEILKTATRLQARISERFEGSGLSGVAAQLVELTGQARETSRAIARPDLRLRIASYLVIALLLAASVATTYVALSSPSRSGGLTWNEIVQVGEAGLNDVVLFSAAIYFLVSFETRAKRGRVVRALHKLRTLSHLIDVHQLNKHPEMIGFEGRGTEHSPTRTMTAFEMGRYLDYCSEMLSLTGKIAALYGDGFDDSEALDAVNDLEELTISLQRKIWQKMMLLHAAAPAPTARGAEA